jgi:hypothetical protein
VCFSLFSSVSSLLLLAPALQRFPLLLIVEASLLLEAPVAVAAALILIAAMVIALLLLAAPMVVAMADIFRRRSSISGSNGVSKNVVQKEGRIEDS